MAFSGVKANDECVKLWNDFKLHSSKISAIIYKINDDATEVVVENTLEKGSSWEDFVKCFPEDQARFAVYNFQFNTEDGRMVDKMLFILWVPDRCPTRAKMLYSSTKNEFKKNLPGIQVDLEASGNDDLDHENVKAHIGRFTS
eukprot:gb/GECH01011380.1/.p1 GENE.gb/GECH01011380.1/~~gb/GECH01011380.1/.p1  ORF type:complete len:143 (+),score=34.64 gb/GECH01011380.1/:1-429(+)